VITVCTTLKLSDILVSVGKFKICGPLLVDSKDCETRGVNMGPEII